MASEPLIIKKRGEDGNKIITVRIREDILAGLDRLANESNYSRNELINIILDYGVKTSKYSKRARIPRVLFSILIRTINTSKSY